MGTGRLVFEQMLDRHRYEPQELGARCDKCILKEIRIGGPVGPSFDPDNKIAVIAESPADKEVERNRPLVGASGLEFNNALQAVGINRSILNIHHALACQPPENDLDKALLKLQRENKKRAKEGLEILPSPIDCCRPRLLSEIDETQNIITLGKVAYQAISGQQKSITEIRGGPVVGYYNEHSQFVAGEADPTQYAFAVKVLPTLHPSFVIRMRRWSRAFKADLSRAFRWFTVGLNWKEPEITVNPTPQQLAAFLSNPDANYVVDVETSFDDPTVADLRTVGIGTEEAAVVCVLKSIETGASAYTNSDDLHVREILKAFFANEQILKVGQNHGYFDQMVIRQHFGVDMKPILDTILMHRVVEPELPHKLAYIGSVYTDVVAWKAAHTAAVAATDQELAVYCGVDTAVTARVAPQLATAVKLRGQLDVMRYDHRIQRVCLGLHENGMFVDRKARDEVAKQLLGAMAKYRKEADSIVGRPVNLNSVYQLRDLIFGEWKVQPAEYTKLGDPSTNDESIRTMRTANKGNAQVVSFFDALRRYRKVAKEYGTYVRRLIPYGVPLDSAVGFLNEDEEEEANRGLIMADGRLRSDYNAHGTTSGRLSSSNPNCFSADTEILTERGWFRFDELPRQVRVAQYHADGRIDWVVPEAYIEQEFDGDLVHIRNQHIDLMVTPDHRCLLRNRRTSALRVFEAEDYPSDWHQINAGELVRPDTLKGMSEALLQLIVAAQADGSWVKGTVNRRLTFKFRKSRKIERLRAIIAALGTDVTVRIDREAMNGGSLQRRIEIEGRAVDQTFESIGPEKLFGSWLLRLPSALATVFCDEVFYWDGCFTRQNHYSSNSKENASWVQTMLVLAGHRANLRAYAGSKNTNWQVDVTRRDYSLTTNVEKAPFRYAGKVYCVSVPSSYVLVRRNGKVMVTGQCQNWPKHLRKLIIPQPGCVIVGADADQLELRIITAIAQIKVYLEAFADKKDPHAMTASLMFGKNFEQLVPKSSQWDKLRNLSKGIKYASFYGSGDETVHGIITSAEDKEGNLLYPDLTVREVSTIRRNWLNGIPELPRFWEDRMEEFRSNGFVLDPVWGRRRDFLDGEAFNEIVNHPVQSAGAAIVHLSTFDLLEEIPFEKWGKGTGLISQVHDALYVEVPCDHPKYEGKDAEFNWCPPKCRCQANWAARTIEKHMNREVPGLDGVVFSAKAKIGKNWSEV